MKLDIARQPLIPAFLTLFAFAVTAMCCADSLVSVAATTPMAGPDPVTATGDLLHGWSAGTADDLHFLVSDRIADAGGRLAIPLPQLLLVRFQTTFPVWARFVAGFLILFAGMCTGRLTVRYNLYSVGSCIAIPLFAFIACPSGADGLFLPAFTASALLALTVKNFSRSFCNGYGFDAVFRASFYLGLLPLVTPAALPLLLLLPFALFFFRRTVREAVVAATGLLLPVLTLCYINWGAGGTFSAPLIAIWATFTSGSPFDLFTTLPVPLLALIAGTSLLVLTAVFLFLSDIYAAGTKPRFILIFTICTWVLTLLLLCGGAATRGDTLLAAVPAAVLLPVLFVRMHRLPALSLYLILFATGLSIIVLQ